MLDFLATTTFVAVIVINAGAVAGAIPAGLPARLALLAVVGLWTGLAAALAGSGALRGAGLGPVPVIGVLVMVPPIAVAATALLSPAFRRTMLGLPVRLLIGLNGFRILGLGFLMLAVQGRLAGPFPYSAGWGDVLTGALAILLIAGTRHGARDYGVAAQAWNWFGMLDLFAAVALGVMSIPGSPLYAINTGIAGPSPMLVLPWSLIPTVLVPAYLILHGVLFVQLRGTAAAPLAAQAS